MIESPGITWSDMQAMPPEEVADSLDFLQVVNDRKIWQSQQQGDG